MSAAILQARLKEGVSTICRAWVVTRRDGVSIGFTDHDLDLAFEDVTFEAGAGMDAGAVERSTGLSVDNTVALGALTSDRVSEADILAGRYDGAKVRQWLVDWSDVDARMELFRGTIGEVRASGGAFEAELRGLAEALNHPVGRAFLKTCDRVLGDTKCGVDTSDPTYSVTASVVSVTDQLIIGWEDSYGYQTGWFTGGALTWETGANAGISALVRRDTGSGTDRVMTLWAEARAEAVVGDTFRVVAGCDKYIETCAAKFDNAVNFRGFPHMPGEDWVTAYPKQGTSHDGTVRRWEEIRHDL